MSKKQFKIHIQNPCQEDFSKMTPAEKGRHCKSCDKVVVDFSKMSDRQIAEFVKKKEGGFCGRLHISQINRPINFEPPRVNRFLGRTAGFLLSGLMATGSSFANSFDQQPSHEQNEVICNDDNQTKVESERNESNSGSLITEDPKCEIDFLEEEIFFAGIAILGDITTIFNHEYVTTPFDKYMQEQKLRGEEPESFSEFNVSQQEKESVQNPSKLPPVPPLKPFAINKVYPNPFINEITIELEMEEEGEIIISIFDTSGRMIFQSIENASEGKQNIHLELEGTPLNDNFYILRIEDGHGTVHTQKLVRSSSDSFQARV